MGIPMRAYNPVWTKSRSRIQAADWRMSTTVALCSVQSQGVAGLLVTYFMSSEQYNLKA